MTPMNTIVVALAALGTTSAFPNDWVLTDVAPLVAGRMDPIIDPGAPAGHVHLISGASNFRSVLNTPEEQQNADCSSTNVQTDKSSYWQPSVYFINQDNEYEALEASARIYYFAKDTVPWPPGMRIVSGYASKRVPNTKVAQGVLWSATPPGGSERDNGFWLPNGTSFADGVQAVGAGVAFPSCGWANQSLDSEDHFSHLTWPINMGGGLVWTNNAAEECPPSHPIKYPTLFYQVIYNLNERQQKVFRRGNDGISLILSNGDTTGMTLHADFVNGWDTAVLQDAINHCTGSNQVGESPERCSAFAPHTKANNDQCRFQGMIPDEEIGYYKALKNLPGCNPRWDRDGGDSKPSNCPDFVQPGWTPPNAVFSDWLAGKSVPVVVKGLDKTLTVNDQLEAVTGVRGFISSWPVVGGGPDKFPFGSGGSLNPDGTQTATPEDIADNTDLNTAKNKVDTIKGQKDSSAWDVNTIQGPPTSIYRTLSNLYSVTFTMLNGDVKTAPDDIRLYQTANPEEGNGVPKGNGGGAPPVVVTTDSASTEAVSTASASTGAQPGGSAGVTAVGAAPNKLAAAPTGLTVAQLAVATDDASPLSGTAVSLPASASAPPAPIGTMSSGTGGSSSLPNADVPQVASASGLSGANSVAATPVGSSLTASTGSVAGVASGAVPSSSGVGSIKKCNRRSRRSRH